MKYFKNSREVSLSFSESGQMIESEEDMAMSDLAPEVAAAITQYIKTEYPGAAVLELEKRVDRNKQEFIDVEIRHRSSSSGYWELSFSPAGRYISRELEDVEIINTLN